MKESLQYAITAATWILVGYSFGGMLQSNFDKASKAYNVGFVLIASVVTGLIVFSIGFKLGVSNG